VTPSEGLLDLMGRLSGEIGRFLDQRFELFKAELKQEAADTARSLGLLATGAGGAGLGVVLLLLALALWIGDAVGSRSGGFAIVGGALALGGGVLALLAIRRLEHRRLARNTADDFRRDAEWIRHEV
jgi:hypothetical protein